MTVIAQPLHACSVEDSQSKMVETGSFRLAFLLFICELASAEKNVFVSIKEMKSKKKFLTFCNESWIIKQLRLSPSPSTTVLMRKSRFTNVKREKNMNDSKIFVPLMIEQNSEYINWFFHWCLCFVVEDHHFLLSYTNREYSWIAT